MVTVMNEYMERFLKRAIAESVLGNHEDARILMCDIVNRIGECKDIVLKKEFE